MSDIALRFWQAGVETVYATAVAATRKWYGQGAIQQVGAEPTLVNEDRASYDAFHRASVPVLDYDWTFQGGLDLDDVVEQLRMAVNGAVTAPAGGGPPYIWTFTPGAALSSATLEWDAAGEEYEMNGCMCDSFKLSGDANGGDVALEMSGPGKTRSTTTMTSLSDHATNVVQGWELKFYVDDLGDTPGTTEVPLTLIRWDIEVANALARKRRGDNSRYIAGLARGRRMLTGSILAEMNAAVLAEVTAQEAVTERLVRLELANNVVADNGNYIMYIDVPCVLRAHTIEDDAEMTVVSFDFTSLYDSTNAFAYEFTVQNARAT